MIVALAKGLLALAVIASLWAEFNLSYFRGAFARWPDEGSAPTFASRFSTWDVAHYLRLSRDGYETGSKSCAFYPLWPSVIRLGTLATGGRPVLAAMLLTNAFSILGLLLLHHLISRHWGEKVGRDSLVLLLAFPGALFFSFPYSESVFFVLLMLFFWGVELDRWSWVAVAAFLLPFTRATGVFILAPLAWSLWERQKAINRNHKSQIKVPLVAANDGLFARSNSETEEGNPAAVPVDRSPVGTVIHQRNDPTTCAVGSAVYPARGHAGFAPWFLLLVPLLGYAAYFGVIYISTGNAFEGFEAQKFYPNSPSIANIFNYRGFADALVNIQSIHGMMDSALDRGFFVLFLALLWPIYRLNKTWFFYVLPAGLIPALTSWFMSYRRYMIVLFPVFVVLAVLLREPSKRWLFWFYVVLMTALQVWGIKEFINFNWAG
jgi:hypothetical protein